ncbi:MAG: hypothetical protein Q8Q73_12695 [Stagnimonas sp.]|nr:hypothetical protein [Stagnimonas sp.]
MAASSRAPVTAAILQAAIASVLDEPRAAAAVELWEREFAASKPDALVELVGRIGDAISEDPRARHQARVALYKALIERGLDPAATMRATATAIAASKATLLPAKPASPAPAPVAAAFNPLATGSFGRAPSRPAYVVFERFCETLLHGVQSESPSAGQLLAISLRAQAGRAKAFKSRLNALADWAAGGSLESYREAADSELSEAAHCLYIALCEALGPVSADAKLALAVQTTQKLPEAAAFPPRKLL